MPFFCCLTLTPSLLLTHTHQSQEQLFPQTVTDILFLHLIASVLPSLPLQTPYTSCTVTWWLPDRFSKRRGNVLIFYYGKPLLCLVFHVGLLYKTMTRPQTGKWYWEIVVLITAPNHQTCDALMAGLVSDFSIVSVKKKKKKKLHTRREATGRTVEDSISPFWSVFPHSAHQW